MWLIDYVHLESQRSFSRSTGMYFVRLVADQTAFPTLNRMHQGEKVDFHALIDVIMRREGCINAYTPLHLIVTINVRQANGYDVQNQAVRA